MKARRSTLQFINYAMAISPTPDYEPSFIVSQDPFRFGDNQKDYILRSNQRIRDIAEKITQCRKDKEDAKKLFFELVKDSTILRGELANDHNSQEAEDFGKRRADCNPAKIYTVCLDDIYKKYGDKLLLLFARCLKKMEVNGAFKQNHTIIDSSDGHITTLEFKISTRQQLEAEGYGKPITSYLPAYIHIEKIFLIDERFSKVDVVDCRKKMEQFKQESPKNYRLFKISSAFVRFFENYPKTLENVFPDGMGEVKICPIHEGRALKKKKRSLFVHALLRTNIDGKLFDLTDYITWMAETNEWKEKQTPSEHPIKLMIKKSSIMVHHQDLFLIQQTLDYTQTR